MTGGSAAFSIRQMLRRLHEELDGRNVRRRWPSTRTGSGPHGFALHRHPVAGFELKHPSDWQVSDEAAGTLVRPSRLYAFARIDAVPEGRRRWSSLEGWVRRNGGRTEVLDERDALVETGAGRFACVAGVRRAGGRRFVVVSALRIRPAVAPAVGRYLAGVLRAIRRSVRTA